MEDSNLDFVGMSNCFFCGKPKEILLNKRLKKSLPHSAVYNKEPCNECKEFMAQGIIIIGVKDGEAGDNPYRTGEWFVLKEEALKNIPMTPELKNNILEKRVCFIEQQILEKLGFNRLLSKKKKEI